MVHISRTFFPDVLYLPRPGIETFFAPFKDIPVTFDGYFELRYRSK